MPQYQPPVPFESARVGLARWLFLNAPLRLLAVSLVPRDHPWRTFFESSWPLVEQLTEETLVSRGESRGGGRKRVKGRVVLAVLVLAVLVLSGAATAEAVAAHVNAR